MRLRIFTAVYILFAIAFGVSWTAAQTIEGSPSAALTLCSKRQISSPVRGLLAADSDNIFLGIENGILAAFDAKGFGIVWRSELGGEFASEIVFGGGGLVVVTNSPAQEGGTRDTSTIRLIGKESGITAWASKLPSAKWFHLGRVNGTVVAVSDQGSVYAADLVSGLTRSQTGAFGSVSTKPAFAAGRLAFGTEEKQIIVVSAANGQLLARIPTDFVPSSISFADSGRLLVGDERGGVTVLSADEFKTVWKFKSGARVSSAIETEKGVLVSSLDNFVYFLSGYNGDVIWKRRLPGRVGDGGLLVGGYLMVLVYGENSGFALDMEDGKVVDVLRSVENDLVSRSAVPIRGSIFAITTINSLEAYAIGTCGSK